MKNEKNKRLIVISAQLLVPEEQGFSFLGFIGTISDKNRLSSDIILVYILTKRNAKCFVIPRQRLPAVQEVSGGVVITGFHAMVTDRRKLVVIAYATSEGGIQHEGRALAICVEE